MTTMGLRAQVAVLLGPACGVEWSHQQLRERQPPTLRAPLETLLQMFEWRLQAAVEERSLWWSERPLVGELQECKKVLPL